MKNIRPAGEVLARKPRQQDGADELAAAQAVRAYKKDHPYASTGEIEQVRAEGGRNSGRTRAAFDLTISAVKSECVAPLVPGRGDAGLTYSSISIPSKASAWHWAAGSAWA